MFLINLVGKYAQISQFGHKINKNLPKSKITGLFSVAALRNTGFLGVEYSGNTVLFDVAQIRNIVDLIQLGSCGLLSHLICR